MPDIKVMSNDGKIFTVDISVARMSNTIRTMLDDLDLTPDEEVVPLPNVRSDILQKVIEWSIHHKDDKAVQDDDFRCDDPDILTKWDREFFEVDLPQLFDILLAANYLDIKGLLEMGCKTVANMMKGKQAEDIRKTFSIKNDLTPEEEEKIRKENAWCEER